MSRPLKNKLLLGVVAIALIGGTFAIVEFTGSNAAAQMGGEMPAMPVPVQTVEEKPVQIWKDFSARLAAVDYVEIRPQVSGLIEKVSFTDGQIVKQGDPLYTIDPRPYAAAVAQAKADVTKANEDLVYAQAELNRAEELLKTGALSKQVYDQRVNAEKTAKSAIASANARVKSAQVDLDNANIKAPIAGRISRTEITQGNLVNAAAAPLLTTIVSDKDIYADFEVDEQTYLKYIRAKSAQSLESEQEVPVKMKVGNDDKWYQGKIKSFDNKIDPSSGTIRVRAIFANDDGALLPGMFTQVQLGSAGEDNVISVNEKAIGTDQDRKFVYVVDSGVATYREVKLGDNTNGERVVTDGLKPGDKVIIDGLMKLRPGAKVDPKTPEEMEAMKAQMAAAAAGGAPAADKPADDAKKAPEAKPEEEPAAAPATTAPEEKAADATEAPKAEEQKPETPANDAAPAKDDKTEAVPLIELPSTTDAPKADDQPQTLLRPGPDAAVTPDTDKPADQTPATSQE